MRYAVLGRTGVQVSRIALGGGFFGTRMDQVESSRILDRALDLGINVVDTAESYLRPEPNASETILGELLHGSRDGARNALPLMIPDGRGGLHGCFAR